MQAVEKVPELGEMYKSDSTIRGLCDAATQIEGITRHASRHACGVVIGQTRLDDLVPLEEKDGDIITQYHAKAIEKVGLVKMDFLGLQNNTVVNDTVELIKKRHGTEIDLENIDLTDKKVYDMLAKGDGVAVFQMEGTGMRNLLRELRPENLEHIIAQISLYRPGPMEEIPRYVSGRHGGKVTYLHPMLEPILKDTYGMLLYQEQVMQAAQVLAGFTGGQADELRGAMSKKKADVMAQMKPMFVEGCAKNGINRATAEELFTRMEEFAKYAFNKSHAAYYGLVAYWTAYLKVNYTAEFMSCKMTSLLEKKDKLLVVIDDTRKHGIDVLPPDVNESNHEFTVVGTGEEAAIRFGLQAIKGIGEAPVNAILEARSSGGRFVSIFDFCERVPGRACGKSAIETLVKCGAFDSVHGNRKAMLEVVDNAVDSGAKAQADALSGQMNIFLMDTVEVGRPKSMGQLPNVPDVDRDVRLAWEKDLLGMYISDHPLLPLREYLEQETVGMERLTEDRTFSDGSKVTCGGMVTTIKKMIDKNGRTWAAFTLEDLTGSIEVLAFAKTFDKCSQYVAEDAKLLVTGKLAADSRRGGKPAPPAAAGDEEEGAAPEAEAIVYRLMADDVELIPADAAAKVNPKRAPKFAPAPTPVATEPANPVGTPLAASPLTAFNGAAAPNGITINTEPNPTSLPPHLPNSPSGITLHREINGLTAPTAGPNGYTNGKNGSHQTNGAPPAHVDPDAQKPIMVPRGFIPPATASECVHLHLDENSATAETLSKLWNICRSHSGHTEVWLHIDNGIETMQLKVSPSFWVDVDQGFCDEVIGVLGAGRVLVPG